MERITVILLEGFDGDAVDITVGGEHRHVENATTKLLTGYAEQVACDSSGDTPVRVAVINRGLDHSQIMHSGGTLLISIVDGSLEATETDGTPGFL